MATEVFVLTSDGIDVINRDGLITFKPYATRSSGNNMNNSKTMNKMTKKTIIMSMMMALMPSFSFAQNITVPEPEFTNSYYLLTSDSTYGELPKEMGAIVKHTSLVSRIGKIAGSAASVVSSVGGVVANASGSISGVVNGVRVMGGAASAGMAAEAIGDMAFAEGKDIVFSGAHSSFTAVSTDKGISVIANNGENSADPRDLFRIVRFKSKKKERQIRWQTISTALFGTADAEKIGYLNFSGHRYGESSYILSIPAKELTPGEYGIFYMSLASAEQVPVATFSIQ